MRRTIQEQITTAVDVVSCDGCGALAETANGARSNWKTSDTTKVSTIIELRNVGSCQTDSWASTMEIHLCPKCFKELLKTWSERTGKKIDERQLY